MHLSHPGMNLKPLSWCKSGYCISNHSRSTISTFSVLWNQQPPRCVSAAQTNGVWWLCMTHGAHHTQVVAVVTQATNGQCTLLLGPLKWQLGGRWGSINGCLFMVLASRAQPLLQCYFWSMWQDGTYTSVCWWIVLKYTANALELMSDIKHFNHFSFNCYDLRNLMYGTALVLTEYNLFFSLFLFFHSP